MRARLSTLAQRSRVDLGMLATDPGAALRGRHSECEALDRLVTGAREARASALVLRGEAGIGKSALLEYVARVSTGCRTARAAGIESEMELAFAGLQQLCSPFLDHLAHLPEPQREALGTAFGLRAGDAPDRFLIGLGVLSLLSDVADERPLVCTVDDAQWLDRASAQALAFVARRLGAEHFGLVFAVREPTEERELRGLPELLLEGLIDRDARAMLDAGFTGPLDARVRERIVAETRGNPLALVELPRGLTARQLAGGFGLIEAQGLAGRIEESFVRQVETLSDDARHLLLVAAAEPVGDPLLLLAASQRLGIVVAAVDAETDGLLAFGERVTFRHPLVRSAVYRTATREQRREVHLALAEATDRTVDPDRRAWHLATAAAGPNEPVAAELEQSASRAHARRRRAARPAPPSRPAAWPRQPRSCIALSFCRAIPSSGCGVRLLLPKRACMPACSRGRSNFWRWPRPRRQTSCRRRTWSCSGVRSLSRRAWGPLRRHCS